MTERELFAAALHREQAGDRAAFLDKACGADAAMRQRVQSLLMEHEQLGGFMELPSFEATIDQPAGERPGTQIGPYKLLQQIGEGGFGIVYMAEQLEPVRRKVALKVIKPGMDTRQVIARFEAERQALAVMDHPNIAKVLDAGTIPVQSAERRVQSGEESAAAGTLHSALCTLHLSRPYFVMELVRGIPITQYCDENQLPIRERLELFSSVCQAIQHAHTKGIIHRDIKPSNVLVTQQDGQPLVKVIDFGIAKALGQQLTEKTLFTEFAQMVGTPQYMSPEQAAMSSVDIDTRSDIYSLGVLLYELLTGSTPISKEQLKQATFDEIRRIIREDEALKPSVRIGGSDTLPAIAAHRHIEPARLSRLVRGELDWIVMKALEKDRNRRYESASALAGDVQRYLDDEPVLACPPSAWYRFRKLARRNKRVAVMASFVLASLLVVVAVHGVSYVQVQEALQDKTQALEREKETTYLQRTALAGRELAAGNVGHAEELLDECPEHLRGWEWDFLKRQRYDGEPTPLQHSATVISVAFSPDGRQLASACYDGTFQIWDLQKREIHPLEQQMADDGHAVLVRGMAYSRDSRYLAVARHDGSVRVWDAVLGQPLYTFEEGHKGPAWQVAFSPDCQTLASGGSDGIVRLWDMTSGKAIREFFEHPAGVKAVAFRPDGRSVLAACDDGTVTVWDRSTRRPTFSFQGELLHPFLAWFSPDARRLAWT